MFPDKHLGEELAENPARVHVQTRFGTVVGGRAANGAAVFLEIPFALPPERFQDPIALPPDYDYAGRVFIREQSYCAQPSNNGQGIGIGVPVEDIVGLGEPTEDPLHVNIVCPPAFASSSSVSSKSYPVKVYIHGGFLQFGSPHGLSGQAQYVAAERQEVWVNIGYRLSAFGFLASEDPKIQGNFGFKDQWLALEWIKENIESFGGDPNNIQLTGLSAGAHSVHQILHYVSHLPEGNAPFQSAALQSNSIAMTPKTPAEYQAQFCALVTALGLNPTDPNILSVLGDKTQIPWQAITELIETNAVGIEYGTFRGAADNDWMLTSPDPMDWQRSGGLARGLLHAGVKNVIVGELTEEWFLYALAHPVQSADDLVKNLRRYYTDDAVDKILALYEPLPENPPDAVLFRKFGEILSDGQVYLPARLLVRDLAAAEYPVLRYQIAWVPEQGRPKGYVTHGTDRSIWAFRLPSLNDDQVPVVRAWLDAVDKHVKEIEEKPTEVNPRQMLTLKTDRTIAWTDDERWDEVMRLRVVIPGEDIGDKL